jgi:hypothetical protein
MIRFQCQHCGAKLSVAEARAGRKGRCPRCKEPLVVPDPSSSAPSSEPPGPETARASSQVTPYDPAVLDLSNDKSPVKADDDRPPLDPTLSALGSFDAYRPSAQEQAEHSGRRSVPWPVDILLYPLSVAALTTLGIVIVIPLLINLAAGLMGPFGFFVLIPGAVVDAVLWLYFLWYVAQCIADSARGGVRAPETVAQAPGLWEMLVQTGRTVAAVAVALLPMITYWLSVRRVDTVFWSLLAWAAAICPMALLAVTMFDSVCGLNPLILIGSMLSAFLPYLGLVLALGALLFLIVKANQALAGYPLLGYAFGFAKYYLALVAAHLVGRFYWRYEEKLNWAA